MSTARTPEELRAALHNARSMPENPPQVHGPSFTPQEHRQGTELAAAAERATATPECAHCAQLDDELCSVIGERERLAELLDEMTAAVATVTYRDFGEHSSANDPWRNAIRALKGLEA